MSTINFGKYNGQEASAVFESDPSYAEWVFQKYQSQGSFSDIAPLLGQYIRQESRLRFAEKANRLGRLGHSDLVAMQNGDQMTASQGARFVALVQAAIEAGIIEMED